MDFPHFPEKHKNPAVLSPEEMLSRRGKNAKKELRGASGAILCLQSQSLKYLSRKFVGKKAEGFTGTVVTLKKTGFRIAAAQPRGLGAPGVAVMLEELAACGIQRCISIGAAGTLQDSIAAGDVIIPTGAIRDEGTSYHYLSPDLSPSPSDKLLDSLVIILDKKRSRYLKGRVWTTDAPYRETAEEIARYQNDGIVAVDMETSAFLSVCFALNIEAVSALAAADSLTGKTWRPPSDNRIVDSSLKLLADTAVEVLTS